MTEVKAKLKSYRQSPRKVRLVADLVRGKRIEKALSELSHLNKKASTAMKKLIESAVANAKHNNNLKKEDLFLKKIAVDEGPTMKRFRPGGRGRAFPYKKRTSHITLTVAEKQAEVKEIKEEPKKEKKVTKKVEKKIKK